MDINEYLFELVQDTSKELLKIYDEKSIGETQLKFPKYRDGKTRVSEQELRFTLTKIHELSSQTDFYYSVETPTQEKYSFSGKGERSASSDMSFYKNNDKVLNGVSDLLP